ncbi:Uncharacterised protein [Klebsiella pneumoniae]|nr:Uncharacterised protein [Klebsiella pneumoniae]
MVKELTQLVAAVGQREIDAVFHIIFIQRQRLIFAIGPDFGVKRQHDAVGMAAGIRFIQRHNLDARPVIRAADKGARWVEAEERQRQPLAAQQAERLRQRETELRLDHFGRGARRLRQQILGAGRVIVQAQQRAIRGLADKFTRPVVVQVRRQRKVEELDTTVLDQRHIGFEISNRRQHHYLLSRFMVIGSTVSAL